MEIFGIGPLEFLLIVLIMLLLLGPKEMVLTARKVGKFIRQLVKSPIWGEVMETSREIRELPTKLVEDTGLEEDFAQIKKDTSTALQDVKVEVGKADLEKTQPDFQSPVPFQPPLPGKNGNGSRIDGAIVIEPAETTPSLLPAPLSTPIPQDPSTPQYPASQNPSQPAPADDGAARIVIE
jgi:Sec-independent protein translocase protein TatA